MRTFLLTIVVVGLLVLASCDQYVMVTGRVVDARTHEPVSDAEVKWDKKANVCYTDSMGMFIYSAVTGYASRVRLTIKRKGYATAHCVYELGDRRPLEIELKR